MCSRWVLKHSLHNCSALTVTVHRCFNFDGRLHVPLVVLHKLCKSLCGTRPLLQNGGDGMSALAMRHKCWVFVVLPAVIPMFVNRISQLSYPGAFSTLKLCDMPFCAGHNNLRCPMCRSCYPGPGAPTACCSRSLRIHMSPW